MELEKNGASKNRTTFYGIPVLPDRQARLDDMVRHAGLPTSDMKRLRFRSLIDILPVSDAFFDSCEVLLMSVITDMGKAKSDQPEVIDIEAIDNDYWPDKYVEDELNEGVGN